MPVADPVRMRGAKPERLRGSYPALLFGRIVCYGPLVCIVEQILAVLENMHLCVRKGKETLLKVKYKIVCNPI